MLKAVIDSKAVRHSSGEEKKAIERDDEEEEEEMEERVPVNNCKVKAIYKEQLQLVSINGYNGMSFHVMSTFCIIVPVQWH